MSHQASDVTKSPSQNGLLHIVLGTTIRDTQLKNVMNFRPAIWANQKNKRLNPELYSTIHVRTRIQKPSLLTRFLNSYNRLYCSAAIKC